MNPSSSSSTASTSSVVVSKKSSSSFYILTLVIGVLGIVFAFLPTDSYYIMASCPRIIQQWRNQLPSWLSLGVGVSIPSYETNEEGLRYYTLTELSQYDGNDPDKPILLGMNGDIFDVTEKGKQYYGKDAAYQVFAGKDSTRALTLGSLDPKDIYEKTDTDDFNEQQIKALKEQHEFYLGKYPRVGKIKKP